ncbi:two-component system histidine kinase [Fructobacillus pseudoficulneus]|uniref:histidine kinase n=2 Tax=Fructobacillus pseudoficulneus TaxID=220714 RepID=A0A3F3GU88_9LACO|nr:ATP-binding protein [Fructobacillus pseudoficulneus]GAP02991.1 two-component system histidine kinase [Fructobacillus pseudoficulneus]SEH44654.1 Signal transduction histidine kinase [Fructobacillus pseudoficulneus]
MTESKQKQKKNSPELSIQTILTLALTVGFLLLLSVILFSLKTIVGIHIQDAVLEDISHWWLLLILVTLFWTVFLAWFLAQLLVRPVKNLQKTMLAFEEDPLTDSRVTPVAYNKELNDLGQVQNYTMDKVQGLIHSQQDFVSDVSHELRTPVAIVKGHLELLNRWGKDDPEVLEDSITSSLSEIRRMETLVNEMLVLTRAENLTVDAQPEETEVTPILERVYHDLQMVHPDFSWTLDNALDSSAMVGVRSDHLEQLLIILIDNALKYSTSRKEIHLALALAGGWVEIGVQDFGQGIAAEDLDRVFDRFYRVDKARVHQTGGNGLGLSIVKKMVAAYGGQVQVESALGSGSVFRLRFPLIKEENNQ